MLFLFHRIPRFLICLRKPTVDEVEDVEAEAEPVEVVEAIKIVEVDGKIESTKIDALRDMLVGFLNADSSTKTGLLNLF